MKKAAVRKHGYAGIGAGIALLAPAVAADLSVAPDLQDAQRPANWTGAYIGISGGGAWGRRWCATMTGVDQTPRFDRTAA